MCQELLIKLSSFGIAGRKDIELKNKRMLYKRYIKMCYKVSKND